MFYFTITISNYTAKSGTLISTLLVFLLHSEETLLEVACKTKHVA